jgi:hypothetical protein
MRHNRDNGVLAGNAVPTFHTDAWEERTGQRESLHTPEGTKVRNSLSWRKQVKRAYRKYHKGLLTRKLFEEFLKARDIPFEGEEENDEETEEKNGEG